MHGKGPRASVPSGPPERERPSDGGGLGRPDGAATGAELVGKRLGVFRLGSVLGQGRMGIVFLAHDEALLRPTALKMLSWRIQHSLGQNPETWFLAEARAMALINHPNVVQIYVVAKHRGRCYIAMEYVPGPSAHTWIAEQGPMSSHSATSVLAQAATALQAAHEAGVIHGDLKPENLILGPDGTAKLSDFGMARRLAEQQAAFPIRTGTPFYTAPELWRGESTSHASDIYALGVSYFYLLTGHAPMRGNDIQSLRAAHLDGAVPDAEALVPNLPPGCGQIIRRCMAKAARDRYPSAQLVGEDALAVLRRG